MEEERYVGGLVNDSRLIGEQKSSTTQRPASNTAKNAFSDIEKLRQDNQRLRKDNKALRRMFETNLPSHVDWSNVVFSWRLREPQLSDTFPQTKASQRGSLLRGRPPRRPQVVDHQHQDMFQPPACPLPCCYSKPSFRWDHVGPIFPHPDVGVADRYSCCAQQPRCHVETPLASAADTNRPAPCCWDPFYESRFAGRDPFNGSLPTVSNSYSFPQQQAVVGRHQLQVPVGLRVPSNISVCDRDSYQDHQSSAAFHGMMQPQHPHQLSQQHQLQQHPHQLPQHPIQLPRQQYLPQHQQHHQLPQHPNQYGSWPVTGALPYASTTQYCPTPAVPYAQPRGHRQFRLVDNSSGGNNETFPSSSLLTGDGSRVAVYRDERQPTAIDGRGFPMNPEVVTEQSMSQSRQLMAGTSTVPPNVPQHKSGEEPRAAADSSRVNDDILAWAMENLFSTSSEDMTPGLDEPEKCPPSNDPTADSTLPSQRTQVDVTAKLLSLDEISSANGIETISNITDSVGQSPAKEIFIVSSGQISARVFGVDALNIGGTHPEQPAVIENGGKTKSEFFASVDMVGKKTTSAECIGVLEYEEPQKCLNEETPIGCRQVGGTVDQYESSDLDQHASKPGFSNPDGAVELWNCASELISCNAEDQRNVLPGRSSLNRDNLDEVIECKARDKDEEALKIHLDQEDERIINGKVCVENERGFYSEFEGSLLPIDNLREATDESVQDGNRRESLLSLARDEIGQTTSWKSLHEPILELRQTGLNCLPAKSDDGEVVDECCRSPGNVESSDFLKSPTSLDKEDAKRQISKRMTENEDLVNPKRFRRSTDGDVVESKSAEDKSFAVCGFPKVTSCVVGLCSKDCKKR